MEDEFLGLFFLPLPDRFELTLTEGKDRTETEPHDWSSERGVVSMVEPDIIRRRALLSLAASFKGLFVPFGIGSFSLIGSFTGSLLLLLLLLMLTILSAEEVAERDGTSSGFSTLVSGANVGGDNVSSEISSNGGGEGIGEHGLASGVSFSADSMCVVVVVVSTTSGCCCCCCCCCDLVCFIRFDR